MPGFPIEGWLLLGGGLMLIYGSIVEQTGKKRMAGTVAGIVAMAAGVLFLCYHRYEADESDCYTCKRRLREIAFWLDAYKREKGKGALPPAYLTDEEGRPINSWRTLIQRYWWYEDEEFRETFDLKQPWNSTHNATRRLGYDQLPNNFRCDAQRRPPFTNYVAVVGPDTMWPGATGATPAADGSDDDKILVIEILNSDIRWSEPRDLTLEQALDTFAPKTGMGIGSLHRAGINYVTVGGQVRALQPNISREDLRKLFVRDPH